MRHTQVPNEQQLNAINFDERQNVGIIAGPGSGKTFVIIEKIRFYLAQKIEPRKILLVTYTNRGIVEIKARIDKFVKARREFEYAGTLHSICKKFLEEEFKNDLSRLLRQEINRLSIWDGPEKNSFLNSEIERQIKIFFPGASEETENSIHEIVKEETENALSRNKIENYLNNNFQLKVKKYEWFSSRLNKKIEERYNFCRDKIAGILRSIFLEYQNHLDKREMFDFDDLIIYFHYLVHKSVKRKKIVQSRFEKILVDEFQDMNFLQLLIISEISGFKKNIFFVGDPNQAIYGFQGAYPEIFNYFKTNIDISTVFFNLSQNYRSTQNILNISQQLITKNDQKDIFNEMFTLNEGGDKIHWLVSDKPGGANKQIYEMIKKLESEGVDLNKIAIISRTHLETKSLRKRLWSKGLKILDFNFSKHISWNNESYFLICYISLKFKKDPFAVKYISRSFFEKYEIPDYLRDQIEEYSSNTIESIQHCLKTNFGNKWVSPEDKKNISKIRQLWNLIRYEFREGQKYKKTIISNKESLMDWIKNNSKSDLTKLITSQKYIAIQNIIHFYTILTFYSGQQSFNVKKIFDLLLAYVKHFVGHTTETQYLNISTVHGAKGCEFDYVFILNLREGKFPKHYARTLQDIEEERRILFVGMTRAKKQLFLVSDLYSTRRNSQFNNAALRIKSVSAEPKISQFLKELNFLNPKNEEINVWSNLSNKTGEISQLENF
ncbi:ATP-dependent helicase [Candidatus Mycoplasma haematominutum]|uniref:DNA 3'-5' helicase n=1 Tax=Candidatus Mycoplasma haematominutum 'Birmingham 1' TaxID=1116213 RepID=G8C2Z3_9MOLU|nr:ATP-dependent helicase [Candidatus Mycoplasma haematominutum]CCE66691.1 ATP-dependent DNA helicase UvrD/PcrA [Candidatus Mycoplasma haematominutum 'Birmingham 1']